MAGLQFFTPQNWRRIGHLVADAIYERLTGETGFSTRALFMCRIRREKQSRQKTGDYGPRRFRAK